MPELPDVEVFKRYVDATSLHRTVDHAMVRDTRVVECSPSTLRRHLEGHRLTATRRHGKVLFAHLDHGPWLLLHFGMTGWPVAWEEGAREPDHIQLRLDFADGRHLGYRATRKLGMLDVIEDPEATVEALGLGPDALEVDLEGFRDRLAGRRGMVKPTLMNQEVLAGLGNIWTDEVLFQARIHPKTPVPELDAPAERRLLRTMITVLEAGVDANVDPERLPDDFLLRRRQAGVDCPRGCGVTVEKLKVSGRAGYLCPRCQRRG